MLRDIITVGFWNQLMDLLHENASNKKNKATPLESIIPWS